MSLRVELHVEAEKELHNFSEEVKQELKSRLAELEDNPTGHRNSGQIQVNGGPIFKYVMKEGGRGGKIDHRAVYDIQDGKIIVYTIFHRDKGYKKNQIARRF